jgi:hypothetical protein
VSHNTNYYYITSVANTTVTFSKNNLHHYVTEVLFIALPLYNHPTLTDTFSKSVTSNRLGHCQQLPPVETLSDISSVIRTSLTTSDNLGFYYPTKSILPDEVTDLIEDYVI